MGRTKLIRIDLADTHLLLTIISNHFYKYGKHPKEIVVPYPDPVTFRGVQITFHSDETVYTCDEDGRVMQHDVRR